MDLSLDYWERMSAGEREAVAEQLVLDLPAGFTFESVRTFRLGVRQHEIALFKFAGSEFALIPAGTVSIGFDAGRWKPTAEEIESWQGTAEEYGIEKSIHEYVVEATLRRREIELAPFLFETVPRELGWETISVDDSEVQQVIHEYGGNSQVVASHGDTSTRVRKSDDGLVVAERSLARRHAALAQELQSSGFRFPTSDEWEYACGCGEPTLFRWGDNVPCDRYPTDMSPQEAAWRRQWVLSGGGLERPADGFHSDWEFHRMPNAFGVLIASDPYKCERVAEIGTTRGGDGGCMICGGAGFFVGWLTLATAYFEEHACKHDPAKPIAPGYTVGRRVLSLR